MKILFYSSYHATPHIETELEIATRLINDGHEVYFLQCKGESKVCFANPEHSLIGCQLCISKVNNAYKQLNLPASRFLTFPKVNIEPTALQTTFVSVQELKDLNYKGCDVGMAVASSLISYTRNHKPDLRYYTSFIERGLKTAMRIYEVAEKVLNQVQPDEVYLFNGRFLEVRPFMRVCEQRNITFYTHERGGILSKYMLRQGSIPHSLATAAIEIETLWGEGGPAKEEIGNKFYTDRRDRVVQGWHTFTDSQTWNKLPPGFDKSKENIVIFNSSMDEYEGIAGFNNPIYEDDNDGIRKILEAFANDTSKHFYLRVHPNLKQLKNVQLDEINQIALKYKNISVISAEEDIDTYGLMDNADKVITFGSTMGMESVYWSKPVILLGRALYEQLNCLYIPKSHQEAVDILNNKELACFNKELTLKYGYWCLNFGNPHQLYSPLSVTKGVFKEKPIYPNMFWRLMYVIQNKLKNVRS